MADTTEKDWAWWASSNAELYEVGPCATRQEAIDEAYERELGMFYKTVLHQEEPNEEEPSEDPCRQTIHLCEATNPPLKLSDWIRADQLLEMAEEDIYDSDRVSSEFDDSGIFMVTSEQDADLCARVKAAVDAWQTEHKLVFTARTFEHMRSIQTIALVNGVEVKPEADKPKFRDIN